MLPKASRFLVVAAAAAALAMAQNLAEFEKRITEFTLPNGMNWIVLERHQAPVVSFNVFVNAGAVNDPPGQSSMAHMFEHMIGKGTRTVGSRNWDEEQKQLARVEQIYDKLEGARSRKAPEADVKTLEAELKTAIDAANVNVDPNAFSRTIEEQGAVGFNAGTASDYTNYFYSLPSNKTELWFLLTSEFLKQPVFREFYKERDVVLEERRMRIESSPQGKLMERLLETAFVKHPYGKWTGPVSEISALRARDAQKFFDTFYSPRNVVVAVVGDVDPAQVKQLAQKYFGSIPARSLPPDLKIVEPAQDKERRADVEVEAQPIVLIGYKRPEQKHKDDPVLDVLASIVSSGRTGLMYKELVRDKKIALVAQAGPTFPAGKYPNLFVFFGMPNAGHTVEEIEKGIYDILDRLKKEKVDEATLQRVKTKVRAGLVRQLDSNAGLAEQLAYNKTVYGDWREMFRSLEDINKVTADDVQRVVRQYFTPEHRTVVHTVQAKGAAAK